MTTNMELDQTADPTDVLAIDFSEPLLAQEALLAATRLSKRGSLALADAVIVTKNPNGRTKVIQTREVAPAQAAMSGAWWLGLIGLLLAGTVGWISGLALGAAAGWLWARSHDAGIPNGWLDEVGNRLPSGHAATVFMLPSFFPAHLLTELRRFRGRLMFTSLANIEAEDIEEALTGL
jgi:uncharacterized membrane protein